MLQAKIMNRGKNKQTYLIMDPFNNIRKITIYTARVACFISTGNFTFAVLVSQSGLSRVVRARDSSLNSPHRICQFSVIDEWRRNTHILPITLPRAGNLHRRPQREHREPQITGGHLKNSTCATNEPGSTIADL